MIVRITFDAHVSDKVDMHPEDLIRLVTEEIDETDDIVSVDLLDAAEAAKTDYVRAPVAHTHQTEESDSRESGSEV